MKQRRISTKTLLGVALAATVLAYQWGNADGQAGRLLQLISPAVAAENPLKISPVKARERDFYSPNSEDLGPDEMRLIACGTGMAHRATQAGGVLLAARIR